MVGTPARSVTSRAGGAAYGELVAELAVPRGGRHYRRQAGISLIRPADRRVQPCDFSRFRLRLKFLESLGLIGVRHHARAARAGVPPKSPSPGGGRVCGHHDRRRPVARNDPDKQHDGGDVKFRGGD